MSELNKPLDELEALDRSRRHMLQAVVATSILWVLPQVVQETLQTGMSRPLRTGLILAGIVGGLVWMAFMWKFHRFQQRVLRDPGLRDRLDDERVLSLRREAILRGWGVLVVALALGVALAPFVNFPDHSLLLTLLLVGVDAPILFFLSLDRG